MNSMKRINLLLVLSLGAQLAHANVTLHEVNNLGKIDLQKHKLGLRARHRNFDVGMLVGYAALGASMAYFLTLEDKLMDAWIKNSFQGAMPTAGWPAGVVMTSSFLVPMIIGSIIDTNNEQDFRLKVNDRDLHVAAAHNDTDSLKIFFEDCYYGVLAVDELKRTPLMYAAAAGAYEAVEQLLQKMPLFAYRDSDVVAVNMQDIFGRTAAHYAAINGHAGILKKLVYGHSADINLADQDGVTVKMLIEQNQKLQEALREFESKN